MTDMRIKQNKSGTASLRFLNSEYGIEVYEFSYTSSGGKSPDKIELYFDEPFVEMFSVWNPLIGLTRNPVAEWRPYLPVCASKFQNGMPIQSLLAQNGKNRLTIAISDVRTPIEIRTGVRDATGSALCQISFFTSETEPIDEYKAYIFLDRRKVQFQAAICSAVERMVKYNNLKTAFVPETAKKPMYSSWYSFTQNLNDKKLLEQCRMAKKLGMDTIIIDDGWQTEDVSGGYAYCGEWHVSAKKIPDMKKLVSEVHKLGMKIMLWYSVPYIGKKCPLWDRFKNMVLNDSENPWACLDPRFPEVREYLINIYSSAVKEWDLDGFKLDFVDSFAMTDYSDRTSGKRDFNSVEKAVEQLMSDIEKTLKSIKPDIMIEFRQNYIGPAVLQYGNMVRVGDCALDATTNRVGLVDLRLISTGAVPHSDMIIWSMDDSPEYVAKQLIAAMFGVPQISVKIETLSEQHYKVLEFYLGLWRKYSDVLLDGEIIPYQPEFLYTKVESIKDNTKVCVCYGDNFVEINTAKTVAVNGTGENFIVVRANGDFKYTILDCQGTCIKSGQQHIEDITRFDVPQSGILSLEEQKN